MMHRAKHILLGHSSRLPQDHFYPHKEISQKPACSQDQKTRPLSALHTREASGAKDASPLHDSDGCVGLDHPVALELVRILISSFDRKHWQTAIQCREGIMRMTKGPTGGID